MHTFIQDLNVVGESSGVLFSLLQQGATSALVTLRNAGGTNTMNYRFQEFNGTTWSDIGVSGSDTYNTLTAGQVRVLKLASNYPQVRLLGNASGGTTLDFSISRFVTREDGAAVPILSI